MNQTVDNIAKSNLIIGSKYYEYIYYWILLSTTKSMLQACNQFELLLKPKKNADIENLPKSLSEHKNDMPKILYYKNFYYNSI